MIKKKGPATGQKLKPQHSLRVQKALASTMGYQGGQQSLEHLVASAMICWTNCMQERLGPPWMRDKGCHVGLSIETPQS